MLHNDLVGHEKSRRPLSYEAKIFVAQFAFASSVSFLSILDSLLRWPLLSCVHDAQHAHQISGHVIDQNVIVVRYHLAGAGDTTRLAKAGMIDQAAGFFCK